MKILVLFLTLCALTTSIANASVGQSACKNKVNQIKSMYDSGKPVELDYFLSRWKKIATYQCNVDQQSVSDSKLAVDLDIEKDKHSPELLANISWWTLRNDVDSSGAPTGTTHPEKGQTRSVLLVGGVFSFEGGRNIDGNLFSLDTCKLLSDQILVCFHEDTIHTRYPQPGYYDRPEWDYSNYYLLKKVGN